jgi:hypothetical protein
LTLTPLAGSVETRHDERSFPSVRLPQALLVLIALAPLAACGPIQSTSSLIDADVALEAARAAGAPTAAVFEYTAAEVYLHKAREAQGHAQYEASTRFASKAIELAKTARTKAGEASNKAQEAP